MNVTRRIATITANNTIEEAELGAEARNVRMDDGKPLSEAVGAPNGVVPTDERGRAKLENLPYPWETGGIPYAVTYTPEGGANGVDYEIEIPGITATALTKRMVIQISIHTPFTTASPSLGVKGVPGSTRKIKRGNSNSPYATSEFGGISVASGSVLLLRYYKQSPVLVWWRTLDIQKPSASDLDGRVPPPSGGTGLDPTSAPVGSYPTTNGAEPFVLKTPEQVAADIAPFIPSSSVFTDKAVAVSAWTADTTYGAQGYVFRASVECEGVTTLHRPDVAFGAADAVSGNFAPVSDSYAGGVYIYCKAKPTAAVTIPSIVCVKGV